MSLKNDENQALKPNDLVFILAIAGRIDAQTRIKNLANELHTGRQIYYGYALLDSLSSSYSMFKYFFDVLSPGSNSDAMHDYMLTPGGIAAITFESLFLVSFSLLATHFDDEKKNEIKKFIADAWPYFRDVIKGLKNAYKGWRSLAGAIHVLGGIETQYLVMPLGVGLGIIAAANRLWLRQMVEDRKTMMQSNNILLIEIRKLQYLSQREALAYLDRIKYQTIKTRNMAFVSLTIGGAIDGLYLYMGVLSLSPLSLPFFITVTALCVFYLVANIIARLYEEYDFQLRLFITHTKCKLGILNKQLETSYRKLMDFKKINDPNSAVLLEIVSLERVVCDLISQFEQKRALLTRQTTNTYFSASLIGMKNGLYAYSALSSILFLIGAITALAGVTFPPAVLMGFVLLGLVFVIGFTIHALVAHHQQINQPSAEKDEINRSLNKVSDIKNALLCPENNVELPRNTVFRESLCGALQIERSSQFFFQEWFEVVRSYFSGLSKGQKFVDFAGNPLQEKDSHGHYNDTPVMHVLSIFSAAYFGAVLALRALGRGFGRPSLAQVPIVEPKPPTKKISVDNSRSNSPVSFRFFSLEEPKQKEPPKKLPTSQSENNISAIQDLRNTIVGLD